MKQLLYIFTGCFFLFQSCSTPGRKPISTAVAFKASPMDSAYHKIRPGIQHFDIDNSKVNTIKAANGTEILMPAGCFVNSNGKTVKEAIQVELIEAFSLKDFISSGLATVSDSKLLISNGMMYINAKAGGEQLQIDKSLPVSVSMPTMNANNGFQMFTGDGTNWTVDSSMTETDYSITLPLDLLYPEGNKYIWHCYGSLPDGKERYGYYDTNIISFTNPKYENTIIATEEFQRRVWPLISMTSRMSYFVNSDYYFDKVDCFGEKDNYDLWKVYYDNPNKTFRELDSIAKKVYLNYYEKNHDKIAAFCDSVNKHKQHYYINWTDTNYYFDYRKISLKDDFMELLKYLSQEGTKEIKHINDHGVNLQAPNAYDQLKSKGVAEKEINEILTYNFQRQAIIKILQQEKDAKADKDKISNLYESTLFSVTKMGWINCDRFYDDPTAGKAEIYVSNSSAYDLKFIDYSLVIPDMNVRLSAYQDQQGKYSFTQKNGQYIKLPIGKQAVVVGVSMQHDSLFFASSKIIIKDGLKVNLPLVYTKNLNDSLQVALK